MAQNGLLHALVQLLAGSRAVGEADAVELTTDELAEIHEPGDGLAGQLVGHGVEGPLVDQQEADVQLGVDGELLEREDAGGLEQHEGGVIDAVDVGEDDVLSRCDGGHFWLLSLINTPG